MRQKAIPTSDLSARPWTPGEIAAIEFLRHLPVEMLKEAVQRRMCQKSKRRPWPTVVCDWLGSILYIGTSDYWRWPHRVLIVMFCASFALLGLTGIERAILLPMLGISGLYLAFWFSAWSVFFRGDSI